MTVYCVHDEPRLIYCRVVHHLFYFILLSRKFSILCNPKVCDHVHKILWLGLLLSQFNPLKSFRTHCCMIQLDNTFPSTFWSPLSIWKFKVFAPVIPQCMLHRRRKPIFGPLITQTFWKGCRIKRKHTSIKVSQGSIVCVQRISHIVYLECLFSLEVPRPYTVLL